MSDISINPLNVSLTYQAIDNCQGIKCKSLTFQISYAISLSPGLKIDELEIELEIDTRRFGDLFFDCNKSTIQKIKPVQNAGILNIIIYSNFPVNSSIPFFITVYLIKINTLDYKTIILT